MKDHAFTDYEISKHRRYRDHIVLLDSVNKDGLAKIIVGSDGSWMRVPEKNLEALTDLEVKILKEQPAMRYALVVQEAIRMEKSLKVLKEAIESALEMGASAGDAYKILRRAARDIGMTLEEDYS